MITDRLFSTHFDKFPMETPQVARKIVEKGILASKARLAANVRVK